MIKDGSLRRKGGFGSLSYLETLLPDSVTFDAATGDGGNVDALQSLLEKSFLNPALDVAKFIAGNQRSFKPKNHRAYELIKQTLNSQGHRNAEQIDAALRTLDFAAKNLKDPRNKKIVRDFLKAAENLD